MMDENGVAKKYNSWAEQYKSIPFAENQSLDIDRYVVGKALDGLFYELAAQEKAFQKNLAARTSSSLKEVFANARR